MAYRDQSLGELAITIPRPNSFVNSIWTSVAAVSKCSTALRAESRLPAWSDKPTDRDL